MEEDLLLQAAQLGRRLEAEVLAEPSAVALEGPQRLGLAPGSVQRVHQLGDRSLTQRVLLGQRLQLADQLGCQAAPEIGLDARLDGVEAQLFQAGDVGAGELVVGEVLQRRPAPQVEGVTQDLGGAVGIVGEAGAGVPDGGLEAVGVERGRIGADRVAVVTGDQHAALAATVALRLERRPQPGDVHPQRLLLARPVVTPELLEDAVGGHDPVDVEQQQGEQRPLLVRPEVDGLAARSSLQGTEDPELHHAPSANWR